MSWGARGCLGHWERAQRVLDPSAKKKKKKDIYYQRLFVPGFSVLKRQSKFSLQLKGLQNRKSEVGGVGLKQKAPSITQEARGVRREPLR